MADWFGTYMLFKREFLRFFKVPNNTIFPQLMTTLFFLLIFGVAIGSKIPAISGIQYVLFILPGLFVQNLINGSYSNPSGSLFVGRQWGNIKDVLLAPISHMQFCLAFVIAGMLRGMILATGTMLLALFFVNVSIVHPWILLVYVLLITFCFACAGFIIGLWCKNWEQLNIFINFVVTPLTFLGGVFYTTDMVPTWMSTITKMNPIHSMISGVRYGMIGLKETNPYSGMIILCIIGIVLFSSCYALTKKGWHLRT